jgi:hypothetical protein
MANDVVVKIDIRKPAGKLGFGIPLILSVGKAVDYKECTELADVIGAGYAVDSPTYKAASIMLEQNNAPASFAVLGVTSAETMVETLTANADKGWRRLVIIGAEAAAIAPVKEYINTKDDKMLFVVVPNTEGLTALGNGDRTVGFIHSNPAAAAALAGEASGLNPGGFTYKNLILNGIEPMKFTETELKEIHDKNGLTFVQKAGDNVTSEGKAMSGEYIDIIDSKDWVISQIVYRTQKLLNTLPKVPYDNVGITLLENVCLTVLKEAAGMGMIAYDENGRYLYTTDYALRSETDATDRVERKYIGGKFSFELAGAIHTITVNGEISI